jgi:hypothetical protein
MYYYSTHCSDVVRCLGALGAVDEGKSTTGLDVLATRKRSQRVPHKQVNERRS